MQRLDSLRSVRAAVPGHWKPTNGAGRRRPAGELRADGTDRLPAGYGDVVDLWRESRDSRGVAPLVEQVVTDNPFVQHQALSGRFLLGNHDRIGGQSTIQSHDLFVRARRSVSFMGGCTKSSRADRAIRRFRA